MYKTKKAYSIFLLILMILGSALLVGQTTFANDSQKITDAADVPLVLVREPSDYKIKEVNNVNVLYQYGVPVPSFDTWKREEKGRHRLPLDDDWKFSFENIEYEGLLFEHNKAYKNEDLLINSTAMKEKWYSPNFDDSDWKTVAVPHVWDLEDIENDEWYDSSVEFNPDKAFRREFGWYRKDITVSEDFIENRSIRLNALGIETQAWIFVNGQYVGAHEGGYEPFSMVISEYLSPGTNNISIRVWRRPQRRADDPDIKIDELAKGRKEFYQKDVRSTVGPGGSFPYGGIKREIWLESTNKVNVSKILTKAEDGLLNIYAVLYNSSNQDQKVGLEFDPGTGDSKANEIVDIEAGETRVVQKNIEIPAAENWSPADPNLYNAKVTLYKDETELIDSLTAQYGMRKIEIKDGNIYLNGKRILLKGFVWYEDFNPQNVTSDRETYKFHLNFIKNELKANFLREHPYHPKAQEVADEVGMLLMIEELNNWLTSFLMNYQLRQYNLSEALVASKVWNNINHPSVIIWSLANELGDYDTSVASKFIKSLNKISKDLDVQDRPTTACLRAHGQYTNSIAKHLDIYSFNTKRSDYSDKSSQQKVGNDNNEGDGLRYTLNQIVERFPDKPILFSEAGPSWTTDYGKVNPNIFKMWDFILKEEYPVIGFAYWSYNDYKSGLGNFRGGGFTHSGIVKEKFNQDYMEKSKLAKKPYMVWLGHNFDKLYNPYSLTESSATKIDEIIWKDVKFNIGKISKEDNQIRGTFDLKIEDARSRNEDQKNSFENEVLTMHEKYWWFQENDYKFSYNEDLKLENTKIILSVGFYKMDKGEWKFITKKDQVLIENTDIGKDLKTVDFESDLPEEVSNKPLIKSIIEIKVLINDTVRNKYKHTQIL